MREAIQRYLHTYPINVLMIIFVVALATRLHSTSLIEYYPDFMPIIGGETLVEGQSYPFQYLNPIGPVILFAPMAFFFHVLVAAQILIRRNRVENKDIGTIQLTFQIRKAR